MARMPSTLAILAVFAFVGPVWAEEPGEVRISDSALPWNRAFTVRDESLEEIRSLLPMRSSGVDIPASGKWGVTINLDIKDTTYEKMDRMSAGAYFDLSPRIRLGGSLSFSAPGDFRLSTPGDRTLPVTPIESEPVIRIESSIKF